MPGNRSPGGPTFFGIAAARWLARIAAGPVCRFGRFTIIKRNDGVLMPAMIANVHLIYAEAKGMVAVPAAALGAVAADGWRSLRVLGPERAAAERRF